jgi:hypothetical protein
MAFGMSIGFNYSYNVPKEAFYSYDWLVIHPDAKTYKTSSKLIAYISVGERIEKLNKEWIIGKNRTWNSYIMDIRKRAYQNYLLEEIEEVQNFDGFFFDTLDSYQMTQVNKEEYQKALSNFLKRVKEKYPNKIIIFNRGFELLDEVQPTAIVAENLFTLNGKEIPEGDRQWLIDRLNAAKKQGVLPVVIEYIDPFDRKKALTLAKRIQHLGFIPYVSDKNLYAVGVSETFLFPRKILVIYNVDEDKKPDSRAHVVVSMPLEFFGFTPDLVHIKNLPQDTSIYHSIIIVLEAPVKNQETFKSWLQKQIKQNKKILFLSSFELEDVTFLDIETTPSTSYDYQLHQTKLQPFETPFDMDSIKSLPIFHPKGAQELLSFKNSHQQVTVTAAKTPWGGYFLNPFDEYNNILLWKVDPFEFLPSILEFPTLPLPDFTTENGSRIWFSHIDGDGFVNRNDKSGKFAAEVLYEEVFTKYDLPFSESIIEAEIAPYGIYPKDSKEALKIADKIFRLKNIELASHSFSHPFDWADPEHPRLPVKNYNFSYEREIEGSLKFLSERFHREAKLLFWTGACNPTKETLAYANQKGILTINGQDTCIMNSKKFLFYVAPLGIYKGDYFQVYGQIANENIFTDLWKHKVGYIKAIQTIKLTDEPRRLKPIDVYYHNYSGAYKASLYALKKVIDYTMKQDIVPMFTSEWIKIAHDFEDSYVIQDLDGNVIFKNHGDLRTLKIQGKHPVDISKSEGVIGYIFQKGYTYISLDNGTSHKIVFGQHEDPYLIKANKRLRFFQNNLYRFDSRFGELKVEFYMPQGCQYSKNHTEVRVHCATAQ